MELDAPLQISEGVYSIKLNAEVDMTVTYMSDDVTSNSTPPIDNLDFRTYIALIANHYEPYSARWFTRPMLAANFLNRVSHIWDFKGASSISNLRQGVDEVEIRQVWCPEQIRILPRSYQIQWALKSQELIHPSGQDIRDDSDEFGIPLVTDSEPFTIHSSLRGVIRKKIRRARIRAALAKWKLQELTAHYYEKYGTLEGGDAESALSSELDSEEER